MAERLRGRTSAPMDEVARGRWLVALFVVSGAAGLVHEVVWMRLLGHVFWASAAAASTVLAAYMGGLALGSAWAPRLLRVLAGRPAYAVLELGIAMSAVAVPFVLRGVEWLYLALWPSVHGLAGVQDLVRFVAAALALLVPTVLMGATLPALSAQVATVAPVTLYAANLVGAAGGVVLSGFVLLPSVGLWGAVVMGVALNVLAGAMSWSRLAGPAARSAEAGTGAVGADATAPWLLIVAATSGVLSLGVQVAWTRVLVLVVGGSTYAFSTVVLAVLVALAAAGIWVARRPLSPDAAPARIVAALLGFAVATALAVFLLDGLPLWYYRALRWWRPEGIADVVALNTVTTTLVLAPGFVAGGLVLPAVLAHLRGGHGAVAVGRVYAVNTIGAIVGAILSGFVIVPRLGAQRTLLLWAVASAVVAAGVGLVRGAGRWHGPAGLALAGVLVFQLGLQPAWQTQRFNRGVFEPMHMQSEADLTAPPERIVFHREGATASVVVTEHGTGAAAGLRSLRINGRANASDHPTDMPTQVLLAQLPLLLAPRTEDVLVIGWGSGVTVGSLLRGPVRAVTAVELEPAVVEASTWFSRVNHDPRTDTRLRLIIDDARHVLGADPATYDVIVSEPSHPWVTGVASLFTREFFFRAATRLRTDGLFVQWLQGYQISADSFRSVVTTFQSVFPETLLFRSHTADDFILVGARTPWALDLATLEQRFAYPGVHAEITALGLTQMPHVLATLFLTPDLVRQVVPHGVLNTDANMHVELQAPRELLGIQDRDSNQWFQSLAVVATPFGRILRDPAILRTRPDVVTGLLHGLQISRRPLGQFRDLQQLAPGS